ncbi:MAG: N-6 DNA methylase [Planctomycetes bacterium]|nr:N-6 DNA methylase [Planctomycetota bacterium]
MNEFKKYIGQMENIAHGLSVIPRLEEEVFAEAALNGEVSRKYRTTVPLNSRREHGVFFTNEILAKKITHKFLLDFDRKSLIVDPACGTGNLLIECANKMPVGKTLSETLKIWSRHLSGFDIFPEFVRAAKARLILLAKVKTNQFDSNIKNFDKYFPLIRVQDFLNDSSGIEKASHIILNPPYNVLLAPDNFCWANKKISAASVFMDICISKAAVDSKIRAILPDVLRTGSSYRKWREHIASNVKKSDITIYGQFDNWTDVDVFTMRLQKSKHQKNLYKDIWGIPATSNTRLSDYFDVHVGPVVPHRDLKKGPMLAYIHARNADAWKEQKRISETRRFSGTVFSPPFVVIRRTSRPGDNRAIGTIIKGKRKVAIENHLLVLLPKKNTLGECRKVLKTLKSKATDDWLNERIRCRHLTVEAMKELPLGVKFHG